MAFWPIKIQSVVSDLQTAFLKNNLQEIVNVFNHTLPIS